MAIKIIRSINIYECRMMILMDSCIYFGPRADIGIDLCLEVGF